MTIPETPENHMRRKTDERTVILEQRVSSLNVAVDRVEVKIDKLGDTLAGIVRIEERQLTTSLGVAEAKAELSLQGARLAAIEVLIPGLVEKTRWVALGLLSITASVGTCVITFFLRMP